MLKSRFSFFGSGDSDKGNDSDEYTKNVVAPTIRLQTDKEVYRPGDSVLVTVEITNPNKASEGLQSLLLIEKLGFEMKGLEKMDAQWFVTQKPLPGSRQRRGEYVFLECSTPSLVSNHVVSSDSTKTYVARAVLPNIIPPSYKGATVRYLYYVKSALSARWLILKTPDSHGEPMQDAVEVESRLPLQIWVNQESNGLLMEEGQSDGIVPAITAQLDIYWKEMNGDSEWARANEVDDGVEEGYDSSRDEISSVSSYNPTKESLRRNFSSSLSLQTYATGASFKESPYTELGRASFSSTQPLRLSAAEILHDSVADIASVNKSSAIASPSQHVDIMKTQSEDDSTDASSATGAEAIEPSPSEGFIRGRSYNIRMDDRVLLRFSPRNSDSTYYFSDMIGGTLTFFHEEGCRRCLEVSITLETSETINRSFVHPSRRNSLTITKVQSDHHEVVADLAQTSFLFSIPMDGPMSFSTRYVSVHWFLHFEFFTTPKNVDWTRYEHPLLIEGREKCEWTLPITVHAPPSGAAVTNSRNDKPFSLEPLWVRT